MATETESSGDAPPRPRRRALRWLLAAIVVSQVVGIAGDIMGPGLVKSHPLLLLLMNPRGRWRALAVPHTSVGVYMAVVVFRLILTDPIYYLLGRWYGDAGARWIERKMGEGGTAIRWMESGFAKASWPMVALIPNPIICMLAGASRMRPPLFFALNIGGTIATSALYRVFGDAFSDPITAVTGFLARWRWQLMALSAFFIGLQFVMQKMQGRSKIESVSALERELDQAEADVAAERDSSSER